MKRWKVCARPDCKNRFLDSEGFITCDSCRIYLHPEECHMGHSNYQQATTVRLVKNKAYAKGTMFRQQWSKRYGNPNKVDQ